MKSKVTKLANNKYKLEFNPGVASLYGYEGNLTDLSWGLNNNIPVTFFVADFEVGSAMNEKSIHYIQESYPRAEITFSRRPGIIFTSLCPKSLFQSCWRLSKNISFSFIKKKTYAFHSFF